MSSVFLLDRTHVPTMEEIAANFEQESALLWRDLLLFIESNYNAKPSISYSGCTGKPGWNVKFKAKGKALCTLYPDSNCFTVLVVLGEDGCTIFDLLKLDFCASVQEAYAHFPLMNGTKWMMIEVQDKCVLQDVKKLLLLKVNKTTV